MINSNSIVILDRRKRKEIRNQKTTSVIDTKLHCGYPDDSTFLYSVCKLADTD